MESDQKHKSHQQPHSGRKADKKSNKKELSKGELKERKRNPKAFAIQNAVKAERLFRHKQDKLEKKYHIPQIDRTPVEPPPVIVSVIGPAKVGKSTLIRNLVRHFSGKNINEIRGPVTVVAGKNKRFTFFECNNDINNMIDLAKISDISLLLIDASFGFEMETFEYLNICKAHGEHRIMGVLTHLDQFNKYSKMKKAKKDLKRRFWTEVYAGAKLFYLSRIAVGNQYVQTEVKNLARFLTVYKLQPVQFRQAHPYLLVDRFEDLTNAEDAKKNELMNRNVVLYGYSRGSYFKPNQMVHLAGVGDMAIDNISFLPDPCELPEATTSKRKLLSQKEKLVYSPFSGIGGILYDKDAVYIDLGTSHFHRDNQTSKVFDKLSKSDKTIDEKIAESNFKVFGSDEEADDDEELNDEEQSDDDLNDEEESDEEGLSNDDEQLDAEMNDDEQLEENEDYSFDDDSSAEESEEEEDAAKESWRSNIAKRASDTFYKYLETTDSIQKLVYGKSFELKDDDREDDHSFHIDSTSSRLTLNGLDSSKFELNQNRDWESDDVLELIKDCFVTGKWTEEENADMLLRENEDEMEEYGDFEDLEGMENEQQEKSDSESDAEDDEESAEQKRRMEKKRKLKEDFNTNYDDKFNSDGKKKDADEEQDDDEGPEEAKFYREIKKKLERQAQINKSEFEGLSDELRVQYEGFRPGMYIRIQIKNMPCEFVKNFDPHYPVIVGGLLSGETNVGLLQVRIKKHRWYPKILKTKNPLIISLGWRRFQTLPIYSMQDHNGRDRCLKYTPQHLHCYASFYGPITPQNTGFIAIQDCAEVTHKFRLAATGTVLNLDKSLNLVKKLKVVGHPMKIYRKTAFIQGMFNTTLEATKFEGALIKTVSGIRGHIKKALSKPEGAYRAAFEDKILLSDIVFMRTWYTVPIPEFYYPVCNLLLSAELKMKWKGMKTIGQVRHEQGVTVEQNPDSFYKIMERKNFNFKPLVLPKGLEKALPFKSKVKHLPKKENKLGRVAVVREPKEQKIADLQRRIRAMYKESLKLDKKHALVKKDKNRTAVQARMKKREESIKKRKKAFCKRQSMNGGGGRKFKK